MSECEFLFPVPQRTPDAVAAALADVLAGKRVCDIGCKAGDFMVSLAKHAASVVGVDHDKGEVVRAQGRGLDVKDGDALTMELPQADVYYFWCGRAVNMPLLQRLLVDAPEEATLVYGMGDCGFYVSEEFQATCKGLGTVRSVPYDEGPGERESGTFHVFVIPVAEARAVIATRVAKA